MELQDTGSEMLNGTIWLGQSPSTPYQRLSSSDQQDERNVIIGEQVSMGYHVSDGIILWQENKEMPKNDHQLHTNDDISRGNSPTLEPPVSGYHHSTLNGLKRPLNENHQTIGELERKYIRRDESAGSNVSVQGWSSGQVEELAEHLVADFDGSLSSLAVTDLATAVASYNMSEALLTLPSTLNVCKQEAPSPENHIDNSNLNQVSQRNTTSVRQNISDNVQSVEPDSNHDGNNVVNNDSTITAIGSKSSAINHRNVKNNVNDVGNNTNEIVNNDRRTSEAAASFQFLYSNNDDYPTASSTGNHVSSSQQGIEFNEDSRFQYVLAAATSIATKINEETLTYLNQGQSYEIKLKKLGDLSAYRGKILKSTIRICFHDRRLQYTEREQILSWQRARPGERLLEVDIPLSYGVLDIVQSSSKSSVEFMWDPTKEVGVYIKVNCISTEFTPKKHGGEKGVPFKINVETLLPGGPRLHAASCQIKVFKLKGADRKHKQDRDKILRRPSHEQEKYQPSYDCTVLSDIPLDSLSPFTLMSQTETNPTISHDAIAPQIPVNIPEGSSPLSAVNSPVSESSSEDSTTIMPTSSNDPYRSFVGSHPPPKNRNIQEAAAWLRKYFPAHESTFVNYSGIDLLNLTRQELIQFCGPLDGIRMYNEIIEKAPVPKLVIYCALEADEQPIWKIIRLFEKTSDALTEKLSTVFNLPKDRLHSILFQGPRGIHVLICNDLVSYMEKDSVYLVQILKDSPVGYFKLLLKPYDG